MIDRSMFHARVKAGFIEATGDDQLDFLHGLLSNDVKGLPQGGANRSLLLNHRGHALAQMTVARAEGRVILAVEGGLAEFVLGELDRHRIFDQVELREVPDGITLLTVQGEDTGAAAAALEASGRLLARGAARRSEAGGSDFLLELPEEDALALLADLPSRPVDDAELELERIRAGVPSATLDGGAGVLPQEAGLEPLISYRKGCYLGQEIMARIEARGNLRRGLKRVLLEAEPGQDEDDGDAWRTVLADGRRVGRLGSVTRETDGSWIGLAVLRLDLPEDAVLEAAGTRLRPAG